MFFVFLIFPLLEDPSICPWLHDSGGYLPTFGMKYGIMNWFNKGGKSKVSRHEHRRFSLEELREHDGSNESEPIYIAINGIVFDVSEGRKFYGKGKPYNMFAGRVSIDLISITKVATTSALTCTETK